MHRKTQPETSRKRSAMPYATSDMLAVMDRVRQDMEDETLVQSMHFSSTAMTIIRRVMMSGGTIVTDTELTRSGLDDQLLNRLGIKAECFIDDPQVVAFAEQKCITRAEVAADYAMSLQGPKLIAVGSAPMALNKIIKRRQSGPLQDVAVVAAPTGFASVVQLKERIWEMDVPSIVVRGRKGGAAATVAILNALMAEAAKQLDS